MNTKEIPMTTGTPGPNTKEMAEFVRGGITTATGAHRNAEVQSIDPGNPDYVAF